MDHILVILVTCGIKSPTNPLLHQFLDFRRPGGMRRAMCLCLFFVLSRNQKMWSNRYVRRICTKPSANVRTNALEMPLKLRENRHEKRRPKPFGSVRGLATPSFLAVADHQHFRFGERCLHPQVGNLVTSRGCQPQKSCSLP